MSKGFYIAFEGIDGCGKSTQQERLIKRLRREFPQKEIVVTREPGGTEISEAIREILLSKKETEFEMTPYTEAHLFVAAREQSISQVVKPALERGAIVVADRSVYSSLAYQGFGRELGIDFVWKINLHAVKDCLPHLVILPDVSVEIGSERGWDKVKDRIEKGDSEFKQRVREGYLSLAKNDESQRFLVVDGSRSADVQVEIIWEKVALLVQNFEPHRELQIRKERE